MKLTVVGSSGSFPGPDSPASSYLVEHEDTRIVMDLGNGALGSLQTFVDLDAVDAVLISHLHADHFMDLCSYYVARRYHPEGPRGRLRVVGPAATRARLASAYGCSGESLDEVFSFEEIAPLFEVGSVVVRTAAVSHPVEAYALRLEAGGRSLTYSGDTALCSSLTELASGSDLLLAEASFVDGDEAPENLHMTGAEAGSAAAAAGVRQLVVTHVPPWHSRERAVEAAAETYDGPVVAATAGLVIDL